MDFFNHTGYAQTLEEMTFNALNPDPVNDIPASRKTYTIGDDMLTEATAEYDYNASEWTYYAAQHLMYDGHGSTRQLVTGSVPNTTIIDDFSYDGYGVLLQNESVASANPGKVGAQTTSLLYAGEHFDTDSQNYYLRARWYDSLSGRFNRMDPFAGNNQDPQSLHKYLYCHNNPVNGIDPSGRMFMPSTPYHARRVEVELFADFRAKRGLNDIYMNRRINTILSPTRVPWWGWNRPDMADKTTGEVWEIKPFGSYLIGVGQLGWYLLLLNINDPYSLKNGGKRVWRPGTSYQPPSQVPIDSTSFAIVSPPVNGVIIYQVFDLKPAIALVTAYTICRLYQELSTAIMLGQLARVPI